MMLEKAAKGCLWAKPNDSRGRLCGIYQVSHGAGEKHGSQVGMERNVQSGKRQVCANHKGARVITFLLQSGASLGASTC